MHNISLHSAEQVSAKQSLLHYHFVPVCHFLKKASANRVQASLYGGLTKTEAEATRDTGLNFASNIAAAESADTILNSLTYP
jgi:hypothetical protein